VKNFAGVILACLLVAGCASRSSDVKASYVSPRTYQGWSCSELTAEAQRVSVRASAAAGAQDKRRSHDAAMVGVGVVVFWPALLFTKGDGQETAELARLKGEMSAIKQEASAKRCAIRFRS
jgi:hypothetical protein